MSLSGAAVPSGFIFDCTQTLNVQLGIYRPSTDIQFASVDDAGELEEHRKPAPDPDPVSLRDIHNLLLVTSMLPEYLPVW